MTNILVKMSSTDHAINTSYSSLDVVTATGNLFLDTLFLFSLDNFYPFIILSSIGIRKHTLSMFTVKLVVKLPE